MREKVYFKNSLGHKLVGIVDRDETKSTQSLVVIFGNFNSYKYSAKQEALANFFVSKGFAVFRFDYQGRGESEGDISKAGISSGVEDTKSAMEFIKNQLWVDLNHIGIFGSGLGSAFAILEAVRVPHYKFLVLGSPRADIKSLFNTANIEDWRSNDYYYSRGVNYHISIYDDSHQYDIYKEAKKIITPTLILNGDNYETHLQGQDVKLSKAIKGSKLIVVGDCKNVYCTKSKEEAIEFVEKWLEEKNMILNESDKISQS